MNFKNWTPLEWRIAFALVMLAIAGAGAWFLAYNALDRLAELAAMTSEVWPLAYFAFGVLVVLAITPLSFAIVVGLRNFRADVGAAGVRFEANADGSGSAEIEARQ